MKRKPSKYSFFIKIFLTYMFTFMVIQITAKITGTLNGMFVSNYFGTTALSAYGLISPYISVLEILSSLFFAGAQAICTKTMGTGNNKLTDKVFSSTIRAVLIISIIVAIFSFTLSEYLCALLGASGDNSKYLEPLNQYNRGFSIGIPFLTLFALLSTFVVLDGNKKMVLIASLVLAACNILLDYLFGVTFKLGMFGVGLATSVAQFIGVLVLISNFFRKKTMFHYVWKMIDIKLWGTLLFTGLPKLIRKVATTGKKIGLNKIALTLAGGGAMAAMSIRVNADDILMSLGVGISCSLMLMSQVYFSQEDKKSIKASFMLALFSIIFGVGLLTALTVIFAPQIIGIYNIETQYFEYTVRALRLFAISLPLITINECLFNYLQAMRKYTWSNIFIVFQRLIIIPISLLLIAIGGEDAFWWTFIISEIPTLILYTVLALTLQRKEHKGFIDSWLVIPESFNDVANRTFSITLNNKDDLLGLSDNIQKYCLEHKMDSKRAMITALCFEEIACNIIDYGFTKKKNRKFILFKRKVPVEEKHMVNLRVIVSKEETTLFVQDNCKLFSLLDQYQIIKDSDDVKNIGIKMIFQISKEVRYTSALNINTLIITV